jgi:prepilin-type N-terminal cleavage/methylation domain-containing protein
MRRRGFTLVEVLVAALVAGGALATLCGMVRTFSLESGLQREAESSAALALDVLAWAGACAALDAAVERGATEGVEPVALTEALREDPGFREAVLAGREGPATRWSVVLARDAGHGAGRPATPGLHRLTCTVTYTARALDGGERERTLTVGRLVLR